MVDCVDTNVLVYRFDPKDCRKQEIAVEFLREGIANDTVRVPHQAIVAFVAAVTRPRSEYRALRPRLTGRPDAP